MAANLAAAALSVDSEVPLKKTYIEKYFPSQQNALGATAEVAIANEIAEGAMCAERIGTPPLAHG